MRNAIKILVIIGCIIGILWSIIGFFGTAVVAGVEKGIHGEKTKTENYENIGIKSIISFIPIIIGLTFGIISSGKNSKKITIIINGILLLLCGILTYYLYNYLAGFIYIFCGILAIILGIIKKYKKDND